jgi:acyl dehydratase
MEVGKELGPFSLSVSREQLVRYAGASDDYNPIHYDDAAARSYGLPGVIVHGMLNMGVISRLVLEALPAGSMLVKYSARFRQMVQPGERLAVKVQVRQWSAPTAVLDVQLSREGDRPAVAGRMVVRVGG